MLLNFARGSRSFSSPGTAPAQAFSDPPAEAVRCTYRKASPQASPGHKCVIADR